MAISRTQDTEERNCVLRGKGRLFQEVRIPKNVAAYYEGKDDFLKKLSIPKNVAAYYERTDGYFKKSGYRRTQIFSHHCLGICICCLLLLCCNSVHF